MATLATLHLPAALRAPARVSRSSGRYVPARSTSPPRADLTAASLLARFDRARRDRGRAREPPPPRRGSPAKTRRAARFSRVSRGADDDLPTPPHARSATSLRCNAASKGIQGDGRVKLCVSKEEFDAAQESAGDNLVRLRIT